MVLGFVGDMIGSALNYIGAREMNRRNLENAQRQMDFQERMSNTAYQRAMADMAKAGLNPMLAYSQGGASTPGGSTFEAQNEANAAVSSAMQLRMQKAQIDEIKARTKMYLADSTKKQVMSDLWSVPANVVKTLTNPKSIMEIFNRPGKKALMDLAEQSVKK